LDFAAEDGFDALHAAALRGRSNPQDEQTSQPRPGSAESDRQEPANIGPPMGPGDQVAAQDVGHDQQIPEGTADQSDQYPAQDTGAHDADHARIQERHQGQAPEPEVSPF
jgi:hypothetical protein